MSTKRNRYQEKLKGAQPKPQANKTCKVCLARHCHCGVDTSQHFIPTLEELEVWYGED